MSGRCWRAAVTGTAIASCFFACSGGFGFDLRVSLQKRSRRPSFLQLLNISLKSLDQPMPIDIQCQGFLNLWASLGVSGDVRAYLKKRFLVASGCVAAAAMVFAPADGCAQTASKPMAFDAASVRRNVDNIGRCSPDQVQATPSGFHMTNCPLIVALGAAYVPSKGEALGSLVEDRIVGMPDWLTRERYDIYARIAHRCH